MRKIGLRGFTFSALATSFPAATASNLYSASISGTSYLRSRSEKMGSTFRLLVMIFWPISNNLKVEPIFSLLERDRKSTRLNSSHQIISYAVFCLKKKKKRNTTQYHCVSDS